MHVHTHARMHTHTHTHTHINTLVLHWPVLLHYSMHCQYSLPNHQKSLCLPHPFNHRHPTQRANDVKASACYSPTQHNVSYEDIIFEDTYCMELEIASWLMHLHSCSHVQS